MADKEKIVNWCKSHGNQLFLAGMALLLALRVAVMMLGTAAAAPPVATIKTAKIEPAITKQSPVYQSVAHLIQPRVPFQNSPYLEPFVTYDMFNLIAYKTEDKVKQQANEYYNQARAAFDQAVQSLKNNDQKAAIDQLQTAKALDEKALERQNTHAGAQKLHQDIEARTNDIAKASAAGNPAGAPAPPK